MNDREAQESVNVSYFRKIVKQLYIIYLKILTLPVPIPDEEKKIT